MDFRRTIVLKDGSCLLVRPLSVKDVISLHEMYSALSDESKLFFHPYFFQPKSGGLWLLDEILLILSCISVIRNIFMKIFPRAVYLSLIVLNSNQETVAFTFYKLRTRLPEKGFEAEGGTVVRDDYQNRGLGSQLLRYKREFAYTNKIRKVYALINARNVRAIHVNEKLGFKTVRLVKKRNVWNGKFYQAYEMYLHLDGHRDVVNDQEVLDK